MDPQRLVDTARALVAGDRGLLAMDESTPTCDKRFAKLGIAQTAGMRRNYRDMIVTTPGLGESIGGAILYDETIRQRTNAGVPFAEALQQAGIVPGIKVDAGSKPLARLSRPPRRHRWILNSPGGRRPSGRPTT